jgi:hypothetical protein
MTNFFFLNLHFHYPILRLNVFSQTKICFIIHRQETNDFLVLSILFAVI